MYNAISASNLTYQSGGLIYTPKQFIGEDSDDDGIPDIMELYGLKPNGDPIGTNSYNADSDGDTIPDNVELKYLGEQLTSALTLEQYLAAIYCGSDPANPDTDGDGLDDILDNEPLNSDMHSFLIYETAETEEDLNYVQVIVQAIIIMIIIMQTFQNKI